MNIIEKYKAAIVTFLLTGTVVLALFSIQLKQQGDLITESYYEIEPEPEVSEEELEKIEDPTATSTNKAFNEDQEYKEMMRNFKTVSANDFERTTKALEEAKTNEIQEETSLNKSYANGNAYALNSDETLSYKSLQEKLKKRKDNQKIADEHAKTKSTLTYSLKGRIMEDYDIPRYLCENGGKIVVNIWVNSIGKVTDASVNGSSNSSDQCLIDRAMEYAKDVQFNRSDRQEQIGTITFLFKGKR
ncbi:energy transducer TonB family protein [Winogradskyella luteola]|uniref:Energy transducer TonB n=1 Tax=Winogradskyella luteola TaxID=2828330 RepID=A0A9X1JRS7_9FLAO|nr:energy transducer TonB [Winogradskyella luteola]MBV7268897.1 energy transducer TonB [Winogradskyella luteola]